MTELASTSDEIVSALTDRIDLISLLRPYVTFNADTFIAGNQRVIPQQRFALMQDGQPVSLDLGDSRIFAKFVDQMAQRFDHIVARALFAAVADSVGNEISAYEDGVRRVWAGNGLTKDTFVEVFDNCTDPDRTIIVLSDSAHRSLILEKQLAGGAPSIHVEEGTVTHVLGMKVAVRNNLVYCEGGIQCCFALGQQAVCAAVSIDLEGSVPVCVLGAVRTQGEFIQQIITTF